MPPTEPGALFIAQSRDYLQSEYLKKIETAIAPLTVDQVWWRANDASNSIGNLMLHLAGNIRQWIVGGVGRRGIARDRDREFATRDRVAIPVLVQQLTQAVDASCAVLADLEASAALDPAVLLAPLEIQRFQTTVLGAVYHVVEHFSMHTGQIILLAKMHTGRDAGFYRLRPDGTPEPTWTETRPFEGTPGD